MVSNPKVKAVCTPASGSLARKESVLKTRRVSKHPEYLKEKMKIFSREGLLRFTMGWIPY